MLRKLGGAVALCAAVFFFYAYYIRHFKWRDCFNELGRCFDADTGMVYLDQAGPIWLTVGILALGLAVWLWRPNRR